MIVAILILWLTKNIQHSYNKIHNSVVNQYFSMYYSKGIIKKKLSIAVSF